MILRRNSSQTKCRTPAPTKKKARTTRNGARHFCHFMGRAPRFLMLHPTPRALARGGALGSHLPRHPAIVAAALSRGVRRAKEPRNKQCRLSLRARAFCRGAKDDVLLPFAPRKGV